METRELGNTGKELSLIGLGAWAMGGGGWAYGWGPQDDKASMESIHKALDLGVNWIDTAAVYGLGHAEEVVGQAIQGKREKVFLATKCGLVWNKKGKIKGRLSASSVREELEASLRRLKVETIDLYQIHWPTHPRDDLEAWAAMDDFIREGKILYAGVSNFSMEQIEALERIRTPTSLQPPYSMVEAGVEDQLLPYCFHGHMGVVVYSPMQCGLLTGKMTRERIASFPGDDFRSRDPHFQEPRLSANLELVEGLREIAAASNRTCAQLALSWVLRRKEVTSAIVGARRPEQIKETAQAAERMLTQEEIDGINALLKTRMERLGK